MLPPVILMQMLSSPHFESHFGWASELPEFLGNPKDFSEKSWFYGTFPLGPLQGPPRLLRLLGPTQVACGQHLVYSLPGARQLRAPLLCLPLRVPSRESGSSFTKSVVVSW